MKSKKSMIFPVILTALIIFIIAYLFANLKQPYIVCSNSTTSDNGLNITITENLNATLDSNKISKMELTKTIVFPSKYSDKTVDGIKYALKQSYDYLPKKDVKITSSDNKIIVKIIVSDDETIILKNLSFVEDNGNLQAVIDVNTKSANVVTLKIGDSYSEGELMSHLKANGYSCK
jgi:hypothetical protein